MERQPLPIVTATVTTLAHPQPTQTAMVSRLPPIVTATATLLALTEALQTVTVTRPPPTQTHTEGARARRVPTGMPSGTPRRPTGTTSDKALGRHRAILIHSETRPHSSEAITATLPSGLGNFYFRVIQPPNLPNSSETPMNRGDSEREVSDRDLPSTYRLLPPYSCQATERGTAL